MFSNTAVMARKLKTFRIDERIAAEFEQFCDVRGQTQERIVEAFLLYIMQMSPEARERLLLEATSWKNGVAATDEAQIERHAEEFDREVEKELRKDRKKKKRGA